MIFLGIDLGTSSVKVLLMDDQQTILASAQEAFEVAGLGLIAATNAKVEDVATKPDIGNS